MDMDKLKDFITRLRVVDYIRWFEPGTHGAARLLPYYPNHYDIEISPAGDKVKLYRVYPGALGGAVIDHDYTYNEAARVIRYWSYDAIGGSLHSDWAELIEDLEAQLTILNYNVEDFDVERAACHWTYPRIGRTINGYLLRVPEDPEDRELALEDARK